MIRAYGLPCLVLPLLATLAIGCELEPATGDTDDSGGTDDPSASDSDPGFDSDSGSSGEPAECPELTQTDVDAGTVGPGCYDVPSLLSVTAPLTIAADTRLRFSEFGGVTVFNGGTLTIEGTAPDSVILEPLGSAWIGLAFNGSASSDNRVEGTTITGVDGDGVTVTGSSRVAIANTAIVDNSGLGLFVNSSSEVSLSGSTLSGNTAPAEIELHNVEGIAADNELTGNGDDVLRVRGGTLSADTVWQSAGVPLHVLNRINVDAALELQAGVTVEMPLDVEIDVSATGSFAALGTAEAPVTLRGQENEPGYWLGLGVYSRASANRLEYTVVENGGSGQWTGASETVGSVYLGEDSKLVVVNSTFRGSGGAGLMAENADNDISGIANNTFENNAYPMALTPEAAKALDGSNAFTANDDDLIMIWPWGYSDEGKLSSGTWANPGIPYRVASYLEVVGDWEIDAGVEIQFAQDVELEIAPDASISAQGTADAPVRFVGADALPGYWMGIGVHSVSSANVLENVEILHAGSSNFSGADDTDAGLFIGNRGGAGRVEVRNATISDNDGFGIVIFDEGTIVGCGSVSFSNNTKGDFRADDEAQSDC